MFFETDCIYSDHDVALWLASEEGKQGSIFIPIAESSRDDLHSSVNVKKIPLKLNIIFIYTRCGNASE